MEENLEPGFKFTKKKIISLVVVIFLLAAIPLGVFLVQKTQIFKSKAAETKMFQAQQIKKPEYKKGEVLVKFKNQLRPQSKSGGDTSNLDRQSAPYSDINEESLPGAITELNKKYQVKKIEKVFKGVEAPNIELNKLKSAPSQGGRKIDEKEFLKNDFSRTYKIELGGNASVEQAVRDLSQNPEVEYAEPNYIVRIDDPVETLIATPSATLMSTPTSSPSSSLNTPNDPYYLDSYPNNIANRDPNWNPQYDYQWNLKKIKAEKTWELNADEPGLITAVIDTGVDYTHPELGNCNLEQLKNNQCPLILAGFNYVNNNDDPKDDQGHGTHVTGIITAVTNNNIGIAGIQRKGQILPIKVLDNTGSGTLENVIKGIKYAADNGASVINMSFSNSYPIQPIPPSYEEVLSYASGLNVVLVASAGNMNNDVTSGYWPANHDKVIAVAATDFQDQKAVFSNYGSKIGVTAPGVEIISLKASGTDMYCPSYCGTHTIAGNYLRANGTSMSAPHVSALAALLLQKHRTLINNDINKLKNIIYNSSDDLGAPGFDNYFGYGRINIEKSLISPNINNPPLTKITSPNNGDIFKPNMEIEIKGIASAPDMINYKLEFYPESEPQNITTVIESTDSSLEEKKLANWKIPNQNKTLILKLTVFYKQDNQNKSMSTIVKIQVDDSLRAGWPVKMAKSATQINPFGQTLPAPLSSDIDLDGKQELLVNFDNFLNVFDDKGNLKWRRSISGDTENHFLPVVGDIDLNYPGKEVVIYVEKALVQGKTTSGLMAWHSDGTEVRGFPITPLDLPYKENSMFSSVIAKDKSDYKIVYNEFSGGISGQTDVFNGDGSLKTKIILPTPYRPFGTPKAGDLNGDGRDEIVIHGSTEGYYEVLFAYDLDGNPLWSTPKPFYQSNTWGQYVLGDVNGDGKSEVVVAQEKVDNNWKIDSFKVYIYKDDGGILSGWGPRDVTQEFNKYFDGVLNIGLSLADFNQDSKPEITIEIPTSYERRNGYYGYKIVMDLNGSIIPGFPNNTQTPQLFFSFQPVVGEIGLNSPVKVIVGQDTIFDGSNYVNFLSLHKYSNNTLTLVEGFPKKLCEGCDYASYPLIVSFDGITQSVVTEKYDKGKLSIYVFDLPNTKGSNFLDWPQYFHDEGHRGAWTSPITPTSTPSPTVWCTPCSADVNKDTYVDVGDISYLSGCYNKKASDKDRNGKPCADRDINGNGVVDGYEFSCIRTVYLRRCEITPTLTPTPTPKLIQPTQVFSCNACSADLAGKKDNQGNNIPDGYVNGWDFSQMIGCRNKKSSDKNWVTCQKMDINGNGTIDGTDWNTWIKCVPKVYNKQCLR